MCEDDGDLCNMLKMFETKLEKSGTGFFVGDSPTIADCAFLPVVRQLRSGRCGVHPCWCFCCSVCVWDCVHRHPFVFLWDIRHVLHHEYHPACGAFESCRSMMAVASGIESDQHTWMYHNSRIELGIEVRILKVE